MQAFTLSIISADKNYSISNVKDILINTNDGQITILPMHKQLITSMEAGLIVFNQSAEYKFFIGDAIIYIENTEAKIITDFYIDIFKIESLESYKNGIKSEYYNKLAILYSNINDSGLN